MAAATEWIIDTTAPDKDGLLAAFDAEQRDALPTLIRHHTIQKRLRFVRRSQGTVRPFDDLTLTGATVEVALGEPDTEPSGGTFTLTYGANTTSAQTYTTTTAATLSTALNALASITAAGGVTVTESNGVFTVSFTNVGARTAISANVTSLLPSGQAAIGVLVTGTASVKEVQVIRIFRGPYAYSSSWTVYSGGSMAVTSIVAGDSETQSVQRIAQATGQPAYGGTFTLNWTKNEVTSVSTTANVGSVAQFRIATVADSGGSLGGKFFDTSDNDGPVRVWIDVANGSTAPATPAGGRLIEVDISSGATSSAVATAVKTAIDADSKFVATVLSSTVTMTNSDAGARQALADGTLATGFTFTTVSLGSSGELHGKYFTLYDTNGSVGVWLNATGTTTVPVGAASKRRQIVATIDASDAAANVATAVQTAVDADSQFTASVSGNLVTITDVTGGARTDASDGDTGFGITVVTGGVTLTATLPWNVTKEQFDAALAGYYTAEQKDNLSWHLTSAVNGAVNAFTVDSDALLYPTGVDGTLALATTAMASRFAETTDDTLTLTLEIRLTLSGYAAEPVFLGELTVARSVLEASAFSGLLVSGAWTGLNARVKSDGTFQLLNTTTSLWHTVTITGLAGAEQFTTTIPGEA